MLCPLGTFYDAILDEITIINMPYQKCRFVQQGVFTVRVENADKDYNLSVIGLTPPTRGYISTMKVFLTLWFQKRISIFCHSVQISLRVADYSFPGVAP